MRRLNFEGLAPNLELTEARAQLTQRFELCQVLIPGVVPEAWDILGLLIEAAHLVGVRERNMVAIADLQEGMQETRRRLDEAEGK